MEPNSKSFKLGRSNLSSSSDASELQQLAPPAAPTVTFARRTSSGRYVNYSRDDLDSEISNTEYANYTVHIPPTLDNQPMANYSVHIPPTPDNQLMADPTISPRVEEQLVSSSIFTGGFNVVTRAHLMDKVIDSESSHPQMAGVKGFSCAVRGCDDAKETENSPSAVTEESQEELKIESEPVSATDEEPVSKEDAEDEEIISYVLKN